jgi:hypothetical protein
MGLLSDDTNSDAKYNIEKEASKCNKDNAKEWIKSTLSKNNKAAKDLNKKTNQNDGKKTTVKSEKIDTNGFLKKEDKNDI